MANAAAKKASAAKKEATKIYLPLLIATNFIYVALLLGGTILQTKFGIFATIVTWIEQAYSFVGILEHASVNAGNKNSKELTGGSSLDLLACTLLVQFGSVLHSTKWLWISIVGVPVVGAYSLYKTMYGSDSNKKNSVPSKSSSGNEDDANDPMAAKRKRRAEKRRQKWG